MGTNDLSDPVPMIEAALRGGAVVVLALEAALLLTARRAASDRYGAAFALSIAAYLVETSPALLSLQAWWLVPIRLASIGTPAVFWLFARASFDDTYVPSWRAALPWLGTIELGALCLAGPGLPVAHQVLRALQFLFVALATREALAGRSADLIEARRRLRVIVVIAAAIYTAAYLIFETAMAGPPAPPWSTINAAGLLALVFVLAVAQISTALRASARAMESSRERAEGPRQSPPPLLLPLDPPEAALLARLRRVMDEERAYREEGLSIAALATRLGISEPRLRRLINQRLGCRNFSSFVNRYRLGDALAALADPAQAAVPVLTIALDAGFQSLGPFNRAFKADTGLTPTDYRRRHLAAGESAAPASPIPESGKTG